MNERQKRLKEVYNYVRANYPIHNKTDFANALSYNRTSISAALNGNEKYLTDALFKRICELYTDIFDIEYLLNGNGTLLLSHKQPLCPEEKKIPSAEETYTHNLFDLAMQVIKDNEALHRQLQASIAELRTLINRYGPPPGAEAPSEDVFKQYTSMVADDLGNKNPKT